ncbi:MAG: hypothetical protein K0U78_13610 [Actinomycetia bacterium]|nr:hypothetical protein [Actinomycetes bacterium]
MNREQIINRLIDREVMTLANELVEHLGRDDTAPFFEQLLDLDTTLDLSEPPEGYRVDKQANGCWMFQRVGEEATSGWEEYDTEEQAVRAAYDDAEEDPIAQEVFQHWLVSDWLAEKLEAIGAPIARDVLGLNIWGRTECGQSLHYDHHLNQVAALIESRTGAPVAQAEIGGVA